jgi:hypothetical protein
MPPAPLTNPPIPPLCDAAISRPTLDATTKPGDGNYATLVGAVSTPAAQWTPQPYRSQLALLAQQPVDLRFDGLVRSNTHASRGTHMGADICIYICILNRIDCIL